MTADITKLFHSMLREDFGSFLRKSFNTLDPGTTFTPNWHLDAICWHLEQVRLGKIKRLIITMPPRSLKSIAASVAFPAFVHGHNPSCRFICVSYSNDLAAKHQRDYRALLASAWYRSTFQTRINPSKDSETEIELIGRGTRLISSPGGTLTGRGADIIILDDPLKAADAYSDAKRSMVNDWYGSTLVSRLNDKINGAIVVVTQRLHVDDLVGHLLNSTAKPGRCLTLPAIASQAQIIRTGR